MRPFAILIIGAILFSPTPSNAWHKNGHMAVARVAWQQLNAAQRAKYVAILQNHPHKAAFLLVGQPQGVNTDEWMFVQAATWPDWVRNPHGPGLGAEEANAIRHTYHKSMWHFINLPFVNPAETGMFDEAAIRQAALVPALDSHGQPRHALAAIQWNLGQLKNSSTPIQDQAVALCWVLHLIGDIHQPLHAATLIGSKSKFGPDGLLPPHGDEGGNSLAIRATSNVQNATELHTFWDAILVEDLPYTKVQSHVHDWLQLPELKRSTLATELAVTGFEKWADESLLLAKSAAYMDLNGNLLAVAILPPNHTPAALAGINAPPLPAGYQKRAEDIARKRIVLGGYRLGDQLVAP